MRGGQIVASREAAQECSPTVPALGSVVSKAKPPRGRQKLQEHVPAIYADVEERPFQGRVMHGMKMGLSPGGRLGVCAAAKAQIKSVLTRR